MKSIAIVFGCFIPFALIALHALPASAQAKSPPQPILKSVADLEDARAAADSTRPKLLYMVCEGANQGWHGAFDLAEGGVFTYCFSANTGYREGVEYLSESDTYYYFREKDFPEWYWAISKTPNSSGKYAVYATFGESNFQHFGAASRCLIEP